MAKRVCDFAGWLERHGWTAVDFARQYGLHPRRVQRWASGEHHNPLLPVLMQLIDERDRKTT